MARTAWMALSGFGGLLAGAVLGFGLALLIATPRSDGTFAMREMIVCLPTLTLFGLTLGIYFGRSRAVNVESKSLRDI